MKELKNNVDYESTFCDLQKAKHYYIPKEDKPCELKIIWEQIMKTTVYNGMSTKKN